MSTENNIETLVEQLSSQSGVQGFVIVNQEGIPIRHSFHENSRLLAVHYAALLQQLAQKAKGVVKSLSSSDDLVFLRVRSKKHEILVAPHEHYLLIVIQVPDTE
jgi:dynein light chain roadblock-type